MIKPILFSLLFLFVSLNTHAADSLADIIKTASATNLHAFEVKARIEAETALLLAQAKALLTERDLNNAKIQQIWAQIEQLRLQMRITEFEFDRITRADYVMERDIERVSELTNMVRPLVLGHSNWKTWIAMESIMLQMGDAATIEQVMFEILVPALRDSEFIGNSFGTISQGFTGGNLGELYSFVKANDYSMRPFGSAHKFIMKILAMTSTAADRRIRELRDINQSVRLTIARIQ